MPADEQVPAEAMRLYQEGQSHLEAKPVRAAEAVRCWEQAAELCRQAGATTTQAKLLNNIGLVYESQGDLSHALQYYKRALAIQEEIAPQSTGTATCLNNIGSVYKSQGDLSSSLQYFKRALAIDEAIAPQSTKTARDLNNIGLVYKCQGDLSRALQYHQRALAICEEIAPQSTGTAACLHNIGLVYKSQGDLSHALQYYKRALAIQEEIAPQSTGTATCLNNIGSVYKSQGDLSSSLQNYRRALAINEEIAQQSTETAADLNNIGSVYKSQGDLSNALKYYRRALAIDEAIAPQSTETATCLNNIGGVYHSQGDLSRTLQYYRRALAIDEDIAPQSTETARDLNNIGGVYKCQGDLSRGLLYYRRALAIYDEIAPQITEAAACLNNIGSVYKSHGHLSRTLQCYQWALAIDEAIAPQSPQTAMNLNNIGSVYLSQGDMFLALQAVERSIEIAESLRSRAAGGQRGKAGQFEQHIDKYEAAIEIVGRMQDPGRGFGYAERSRARGMAELLAERTIDTSVHASAELLDQERQLRGRLAGNYTLLLEARNRPQPQRDENQIGQLAAEQDRLEHEMESLEARIRHECPEYADLQYPQPLTLEEVQRQVLGSNDVLLEFFVGESNSYVWAVRKDRFEFHLLGLKSQELDDLVRGKFRPPLDDLRLHEDGNESALRKAYQQQIETAGDLYQKLIQPLEPFLEGADRILLCPDGPLHYLPFEALVCGERKASNDSLFHHCEFWGERHLISYIPSATVLKNLRDGLARRDGTAGNDLIGFGDPDFEADSQPESDRGAALRGITREYTDRRGLNLERLDASGAEVRDVFALFASDGLKDAGEEPSQVASATGDRSREIVVADKEEGSAVEDLGPSELTSRRARVYLRDKANKRRVIGESDNCRYVHFATHGLLDDENPLNSGLAFSPSATPCEGEADWLLQTHEIFSMKLSADLVTLSACQTGLGKLTKGEGLVGMTRAFMFAGTPSVLVSLWNVADEATALFMVDFYSRIRAGKDKATALLEAKRKMMNDPEYPEHRNPFYWAAFVLQGEWTNAE